jgi:hypothetical protein
MTTLVSEDGIELLSRVPGEHGLEGGEGIFVGYCHGAAIVSDSMDMTKIIVKVESRRLRLSSI